MTIRPYLADQWAPLNPWLGDGLIDLPGAVKTWVPNDDRRRLQAYELLAAFIDNTFRYWLPVDAISDDQGNITDSGEIIVRKFREYGDAGLLVVTARAALLGEDQSIVVAGADEKDEDGKPTDSRAAQVQDWLDEWANLEQLRLRLYEQEHDSIGLGDAGLILGWDAEKQRPRLETFDPGWYFPVLDPSKPSGGFPETVHLAWEESFTEAGQTKARVRRKTWRLVPADPWTPKYADTPSRVKCLYSEGTWGLSKATNGIYDLSDEAATWAVVTNPVTGESVEMHDLDLMIDFLPVVHVPNDAAGKRHYGTSLITRVAQLLADLASSDTDLQEASATTGSSALVEKGGAGGDLPGGPGLSYSLPSSGDLSYLDTSKNLTALTGYVAHLLGRLSTNSRLPAEVLGRVNASQVASGFLMALSFGPLRSLVAEMRLVRTEKHALLLKMTARMAVQNGVLSAGVVPRAELTLGSFLPADQKAAVDMVRSLRTGPRPAISVETGVKILVEAGLPIEDAQAEAARIERESFELAVQLLDAVGDENVVRAFLGLPPTENPIPQPPAPPNA